MKKFLIGIFGLFAGFFVFLFIYIGINGGFSLEEWNEEQIELAKQYQKDYAHWSLKAYGLIDLCYDGKKKSDCALMYEAILKQQDNYKKMNEYMKFEKIANILERQPSYGKIMTYNKMVQKRGY